MKKTSYIFTLLTAATALLLSSCAKEKTVDIAEGELVEYTLQAEVSGTGAGLEIGTKVAMNSDGITPNWEIGDKILVLDAEYKPVGTDGIFKLSSGEGTASGTFTGRKFEGQVATYAIYPASAASKNASGTVISGKLLGADGDKAKGSIKPAVMLGTSSDGNNILFCNACAVLKFNTGEYGSGDNPAIKSVIISASYGTDFTPVAGAFSIDWTTVPPSITAITELDMGIEDRCTIKLPSELQTSNKDVFIPIFPLGLKNGTPPSMKYEFTNTSGNVAEVVHDFTDAITCGTIKNLGTAQGLEFIEPLPYVVIDGLKWYKYNLGATTVAGSLETCAGDYYQWGSLNTLYESISWDGIEPSFIWKSGKENGFSSSYLEYTSYSSKLPADRDVARIKLGGNWRMPTNDEFTAMMRACGGGFNMDNSTDPSIDSYVGQGIYWCADYDGIIGVLFCDGNNKLFFPAMGEGSGKDTWGFGDRGYYFSSNYGKDSSSGNTGVFSLEFWPSFATYTTVYASFGIATPIRPVSN